jgi:hypothetical protein
MNKKYCTNLPSGICYQQASYDVLKDFIFSQIWKLEIKIGGNNRAEKKIRFV